MAHIAVNQQTRLMVGLYSGGVSSYFGWITGHSDWGLSWFSSATPAKFWDNALKPFPVYHSPIILPFNAVIWDVYITKTKYRADIKYKYHTSGFLPQSRFIFWSCVWNTLKTGRKIQELWVRYYVCFPLPSWKWRKNLPVIRWYSASWQCAVLSWRPQQKPIKLPYRQAQDFPQEDTSQLA
jgi:hypothetical protein